MTHHCFKISQPLTSKVVSSMRAVMLHNSNQLVKYAIINQSIKFLWRQYPWWSPAQWWDSWISVQQQNWWNSSVASTGRYMCRCVRGKGQVKEMCLQMFLEGSNWNGWTDRQLKVVPERRGTRVKSSCACVGLDPRDWQTNSFAWSQWMGWEWLGKHGVKIKGCVSSRVL